jgi:hypothetical protein
MVDKILFISLYLYSEFNGLIMREGTTTSNYERHVPLYGLQEWSIT